MVRFKSIAPAHYIGLVILIAPVFLMSWMIAGRDYSIGSDTYRYVALFYMIDYEGQYRISEPAFLALVKLSRLLYADPWALLYLCSLISALGSIAYFYMLFGRGRHPFIDKYIVTALCMGFALSSPFFWNGQLNLMRAAMSAPIAMSAGILFFRGRHGLGLSLIGLASLFHYSALLFMPFLILKWIPERRMVYIVFAGYAAYLIGVSEIFFHFISYMVPGDYYYKVVDYGAGSEYKAGVRADFLLFSAGIYSFLLFFRKASLIGPDVLFVASWSQMPFLLIGFMAYSDRLLFNYWMFAPVVPALMAFIILRRINRQFLLTAIVSVYFVAMPLLSAKHAGYI